MTTTSWTEQDYEIETKEIKMLTRTLAASFLALGLLSPVASYAAPADTICNSDDQADYRDCNYDGLTRGSAGFSTQSNEFGTVSNDFDRRVDEKNDNSGSRRN
jgi:hypothetical protein